MRSIDVYRLIRAVREGGFGIVDLSKDSMMIDSDDESQLARASSVLTDLGNSTPGRNLSIYQVFTRR